jgi:hypothetical protein
MWGKQYEKRDEKKGKNVKKKEEQKRKKTSTKINIK